MFFFAGYYINLQDAFAVEALKLGTWKEIGYTGPGSNSASGSESSVILYTESTTAPQWNAAPKANTKLNDCESTESWKLSAFNASSETTGQGNVTYTAAGDADCLALTASWKSLASGRESKSE